MAMIDAVLDQQVAHALGWALVQFVWQGALVGVVTALLLASLRRSAPDVRYVVATIALSLMLTLPVVTLVPSVNLEHGGHSVQLRDTRPIVASGAPEMSRGDAAARSLRVEEEVPGRPVPDQFMRWLPVLLGLWLAGVAVLTNKAASSRLSQRTRRSHEDLATCYVLRATCRRA